MIVSDCIRLKNLTETLQWFQSLIACLGNSKVIMGMHKFDVNGAIIDWSFYCDGKICLAEH